jgi:AcrR family transcriptional regulator
MSTRRERPSERDEGPIWSRPEPGARRPRHSRDQIAATALEIADAEGFEAVSMRRVARELGAGTMTLYHYVRTKDELVELMNDAIMGQVLVPDDELSRDWREAMAQVARRSHAAFVHHPWAFEALQSARVGPNGLRHFEQSLEAVSGLDVSIDQRFEVILLIDDYVFGHFVRSRRDRPDDEEIGAGLDYLDEQVQTGSFPRVRALMGDDPPHVTWDRVAAIAADEGRFERGLQWLLDGIAMSLERGR